MRTVVGVMIFLIGCNQPEPRRPITVKTGTFSNISVARNQNILALEEAAIKKIIAQDIENTYYASADGFWYCYHEKDSSFGDTPVKDDMVTITYHIKTLSNTVIYSGKPFENVKFTVDDNTMFTGLNAAVKLMKKGEVATFLFPSFLAYGYRGDGHRIGVNIPLICKVSLLDISKKTNSTLLN